MKAMEEQPRLVTGIWQLGFDPEYGHDQENALYAGYIFCVEDGHTRRIDIPDQDSALYIVNRLNATVELEAGR